MSNSLGLGGRSIVEGTALEMALSNGDFSMQAISRI